ncbi:DUF4390 domain-containing protein [Xylophilus rhododendri]|uniref:DUF4390 domain-containing protein n=1 Tax=Xylophilus rhododendri TaxID=2697032 RepID=UPI001E3C41FB|nr:DUF4390 domain-containing protein [Xylophilus rhododendri]
MPDLRRRALLRWAPAVLIGATAAAAHADVHAVDVPTLRLERVEDALYLWATIGFDLPPLVEDALLKGVALFFVAQVEIMRERWYWADERVAFAQRHMRLVYQPLIRRFRLNVSPSAFSTGLGVSLSQNFEELGEALESVKRIARWRIVDVAQLDPIGRYTADFDFRLDTSQLPRPLQMGVAGRADWSLSAERSLAIDPAVLVR